MPGGLTRLAPYSAGAGGVVDGAGAEGLVGVDGGDAHAARQVGELGDGAGVDVSLVDGRDVRGGVGHGVEDGVGDAAGDDGVDAAEAELLRAVVGGARRVGDQQAGLVRGEIVGVDAVRRGVDHGLQVRRVGVDVEVEAGGVGLVGDADDAVAGVLVDPGLGRDGTGGAGRDGGRSGRVREVRG